MDMDTIVLKFEAIFTKMKSDLGNTIKKWEQLDKTTSDVSNTFNKMANNVDGAMNKMAKSIDSSGAKENLEQLKQQLNDLKRAYKSNLDYVNQQGGWAMGKHKFVYDTRGMSGKELDMARKEATIPRLTKQQVEDQKAQIDILKAKIKELEPPIDKIGQKKLIKKENVGKDVLDKLGDSAQKASKKTDSLSRSAKKVKVSFSGIGKVTKNIKNVFGNFTNSLKKNMDNNFRQVKKLALGLIGVRTAMALLTRGVNAYLSFDSQLQESIDNSWNMLGALLAPAIELVAQAFALATNYIAQFVSALSGIDLVARANAKALETQAKANEEANKAQRGLLGMDEITNLPTDTAGASAKQIQTIDVKPIKWLTKLLDALKKHDWHKAGEIIADSINKGLKKIDWETVREKAEQTGKNVASFLNGAFEVNWRLIGTSFANGLNTLVDTLHGFFTTLEWGRLGAGIANTINGFFNDFDFTKAGETVTAGIIGVIDTASAFIVNLDSEKIVNSVIDFIESIDWIKIGEKIIELLVHGIRLAVTTKDTLWDRIVKDIKAQIDPKIDWLGEKIGGKLGNGIANSLKWALQKAFNGFKIEIPIGNNYKVGTSIFPKFLPLATGTNEIESEGLYHLHEGEAVVPKRYNPTTGGYDDGRDNKQIIDLLVSLNSTMMDYAERPININMSSKRVAEAIYDDTQQITKNKNTSSVVVRS